MMSDRSSVRRVLSIAGMGAGLWAGDALGQCGYSFNTPVPYNAGNLPRALALADLNNDGRPEIIVANSSGTGQLTTLVGNADGTFQPQQVWSTVANATGVAAGDFNSDGRTDVAVCGTSGAIIVHINQPGGISGFILSSGSTWSAGGPAQWVGAAELNGDTFPDLAALTASPNSAAWIRNLGGANFMAPLNQGVAGAPTFGALADMGVDGRPDMVSVSAAGPTLSVMVNSGSGFLPATSYTTAPGPRYVAIDDFNLDTFKDVAVATSGINGLYIYFNNGSGGLLLQPLLASVPSPQAVVTTDFEGNLKPDLVVGGTNSLGIHLGTASGAFSALSGVTPISTSVVSLVARDLNGDGLPDAVFTATDGPVRVALGRNPQAVQITQQPSNQTVALGQPASMSITLNTTTGIGLQWRRNGTNLVNGGTLSGVNTPTLSISGALSGDVGAYDCRVTGGCSNADFLSNPAALSVNTCYANCDNSTQPPILNVNDFTCFLQRYNSGCP